MNSEDFKWYDRRELFERYEDGEYMILNENGKNVGKYYNYDLNKWDFNKRSKIDLKYIRYEFSCFDDREIEMVFGWNNIDKIGKFLYLIYKKSITKKIDNEDGEKWVYVDKNEDEKQILGSDYFLNIRLKLEELKLIKIKVGKLNRYKKEVLLYRLNEKFYSCIKREVWIRNRSLNKKLSLRYKNKINEDDLIRNEVENCKFLEIIDSKYDLDGIIDKRIKRKKKEYYEKSRYDFEGDRKIKNYENKILKYDTINRNEINNRFELLRLNIKEIKFGENDLIYRDKNYGGRIYNIINCVDKEFRELLRLDGEKLVEVDMVCGYVSLLYRLFKVIENENNLYNNELDIEIRNKVGDVNGFDFIHYYKNLVYEVRDGIDFYLFIYFNLISDVNLFGDKKDRVGRKEVKKENRNYIKGLVINLINGKDEFLKNKRFIDNKYDYRELCELIFKKNGFECLSKLKGIEIDFKFGYNYYGYEKYKNISKILNLYEVEIMNEKSKLLMREDIKYISLFDGLLVKESDKDRVLKILNGNCKVDKEGIIKFK
jgi:hypothetical protein